MTESNFFTAVLDEGGEGSDSGEYPQELTETIAHLQTSLEWLQDLRTTIQQEGVSRDDIQAVQAIRTSLEARGLVLGPVPALEQYGPNGYTPERSFVNLQLGVESIGATIVEVIKTMIAKLVEFVQGLIRWARKHFRSEKRMQDRLTHLNKIYNEAVKGNQELLRKYVDIDNAFRQELKALAAETLNHRLLKRSKLQLGCLGDPVYMAEVELSANVAMEIAADLSAFSKALAEALTTDVDVINIDGDIAETARETEKLHATLEDLKAILPEFSAATRSLGPEIFEQPVPTYLATVTPYEKVLEAYLAMERHLKTIRKYSVTVAEEDTLVRVISNLTKVTSHLGHIADTLQEANRMKQASLQVHYHYQSVKMTRLVERGLAQNLNERKEAALRAIHERTAAAVHKLITTLTPLE